MIRALACTWALSLTLGATGCGGDEERAAPAPEPGSEAPGVVTTPPPETQAGTGASPEDVPGGAGDEEPARSEARLELSGDGFEPERVEVLPFIAIELVVAPEDGSYDISLSGPAGTRDASGTGEHRVSLDGLRPGASYRVTDRESGARATIAAEAEPGP